MKKLLLPIISIFAFFSIVNISLAEETYLDEILDLQYWIEEYNLNLSNIEYIYFSDDSKREIYQSYKNTDSILKELFMDYYRAWEIDYYSMNWIITNYNLFVYHTNKFLYYLSLQEKSGDYIDFDSAISRNYSLSRSHYNKVKELLK